MTGRVSITREALIPDEVRVARYRRAPELGPRILFFSGGSALRKLSRCLKLYTHNSVHLVTPFDSGGSSAALRDEFQMLSVGDLRNRLLSLADETVQGNPEIYALFSHRLPADADRNVLRGIVEEMAEGTHPLIAQVPEPLRSLVRTSLHSFWRSVSTGFDLSHASIGNLILVGGYLHNERDIHAVAFLFSKLVAVRGVVRPIVDANVGLTAALESGAKVIGQHRLTKRGSERITSRVVDLQLCAAPGPASDSGSGFASDSAPDSAQGAAAPDSVDVAAADDVCDLIRNAELIVFPIGSFYSSIVANLLPAGVGRAIAEASCPKVFVPNMGEDVEQLGMSLESCIEALAHYVRRDAGEKTPIERILDLVLVDTTRGRYTLPIQLGAVEKLGVQLADVGLVRERGWPLIDGELLAQALVSLV
jgi:CofD-related protein of GAK system